MKGLWIAAGGVALAVVWGCGLVDNQQLATGITIGAAAAIAAGLMGGMAGAGHARERRARQDYEAARAALPLARRAWHQALAASVRRFLLPVAALVGLVGLLWLWRSSR